MKIYSSINDRLKSQHLAVSELIRTLDDDLINKDPSRGKWSIKDNIAHITLYHLKFLNRMKLIKNEEESYFNRYIPDEDPEFIKLRNASVQEILNS
ncbi:MAG: DinB family protein, partial [Bacteroidetes bacterium]|nr:DinB family protein [Bacteroidota bacterium]